MRIETSYKMCFRKKRYHTYEEAEKVAESVKAKRGINLRIYFCPICQWYHLTSKEKQ